MIEVCLIEIFSNVFFSCIELQSAWLINAKDKRKMVFVLTNM